MNCKLFVCNFFACFAKSETMMKEGTMQYHILVPDIVCVAWEKVFMWFALRVTRLAGSGRQESEPVKGWPDHYNKWGLLVCDRWLPG